MRNSTNRFNTRSAVFTCYSCQHKTRLTSDIEELCSPCYEIHSIDNYFNDNDREHAGKDAPNWLSQAEEQLAIIRKNAGDAAAERVKKSASFVWPAKKAVKEEAPPSWAKINRDLRKKIRQDGHDGMGWKVQYVGNIFTATCSNFVVTYTEVMYVRQLCDELFIKDGAKAHFGSNGKLAVVINWVR